MKQTTAQMERLGVQVSGVHVSFLKEPLTVAYNMVGKLHCDKTLYQVAYDYIYNFQFADTYQDEMRLKYKFAHEIAKAVNNVTTQPEPEPEEVTP